MRGFPHEGWCDLQFVHLIRGSLPMHFEPLRRYGVVPIIRSIDHYLANRNNAYLLEFRVGEGRVLATALRVLPQMENHLEARSLLSCLAGYVLSDEFEPEATVPVEEFERLFRRP
jgi:hypothetical protein